MRREIVAEPDLATLTYTWRDFPGNARSHKTVESTKPPRLDKAALHGVAGDFVRLVEPHTEADSAALLSQFLAAAGCYLGRASYYKIGADHHYSNFFVVLVGNTSHGRKGTALGHVRQAFERTDPGFMRKCYVTGLSTGEGLIHRVRDARWELKPVKDHGKTGKLEEQLIDGGVEDKRLLVVEPEFARTLTVGQREGNTLTATLRQAWDTGDLCVLTKHSEVATGAHISVVGHITKAELDHLQTSIGAANGYGNRFLWLWVERSKLLPFGGDLDITHLEKISESLRMARDAAQHQHQLHFDDEVREVWPGIYYDLSVERPGLVGSILARGAPQVIRIASLYALLDRVTVIDLSRLQAALALWNFCESSARLIFGDALGDETADTILSFLRTVESVGAPRTQISKLFGGHKATGEIERALNTLLKQGLARFQFEPTGGPPVERWFAV